MTKALSQTTLVVATFILVLLFLTSQSYTQLALAIILYPVVAFFALKVFPRKTSFNIDFRPFIKKLRSMMPTKHTPKHQPAQAQHIKKSVEVTDIDKRTFLKLIGATGLSFFIFSILGRRTEALLFGDKSLQSTFGGNTSNSSDSSSLSSGGYRISEVDNGVVTYYGFVKSGGWFIMREDTENGSFRYTKGDDNFPKNWSNRENLNYDYYDNIF